MDHRDLPCGHRALRVGRHSTAGAAYLVTTITRGREPVFIGGAAAVAACCAFSDGALLGDNKLHAWVLMPGHAHWLIELGVRDRLDAIVNRLKSGSARAANRSRGISGPLWSPAFHDRAIRDASAIAAAADYIAMNPVRAGLVRNVLEYPYTHLTWGPVLAPVP